MKSFLGLLSFLFIVFTANGQYAPPAGQEGSTAIFADSSVFVDWATRCDLRRGWMNVADTTLGKTDYGDSTSALGKADNKVVSLGDNGSAILHFDKPLSNGPGTDFAVFENAFNDTFLELAFVEVSSDGETFFRFPTVSLTQTDVQVETFGTLEAEKIHNLAGKYRSLYGVPFDLEELKDQQGLDVNHIIAIKVIDVIGSIDTAYCTYDSEGHKINDPWPTPFESGGFDLDAVGVIHNTSNTGISSNETHKITLYPNPSHGIIYFSGDVKTISVYSVTGKLLKRVHLLKNHPVNLSNLPKGLLIVRVENYKNGFEIFKVINR